MAARRKSRRIKHARAPRWRRLLFEQFEPRQLLANMAPSGADNTVTTVEDRAYTFSAADFGFSDANDTPPNNFLAVKIVSLPARGALMIGGALATTGAYVPAATLTRG